MNKTFNLLFYEKKAKINSVGEFPIYLRITIDGKINIRDQHKTYSKAFKMELCDAEG
ncbi:hypothetical protein CHRY9390_00420 [Chryseobacterium aquaeductus]|uniref:Arm DNA-binding domain-containing protein n=1 Tax=Chryseobacterium aquaeductus TaxID=2675056 RepID=A0A9N8MEP5_9FLAO|nr:hypothetical protein [Chryseobacterium aquaeductus]CAA7329777.1 hypothetical protein CHRY9390_00420 [Chryseobacterium potabilaquae]CAD7799010.1 hypothetical protein CHRY9390_00420 [Chryseobacterium aquaeductus]